MDPMLRSFIQSVLRCDANESLFFARQLESIKANTYDKKFPKLRAKEFIPVSYDADPGALSITYYQYTEVGLAIIVSNYAHDLPRADAFGKKFNSPVETVGASWGINTQEMRSSDKINARAPQRKANACRRAFETKVDNIAFSGDTATGLTGFSNNANVPVTTLTAGAGGDEEWRLKTPDEIIADVSLLYETTHDATNNVEDPDTLLLPPRAYTHIANNPRSSTSDTTILKWLLDNNPSLKAIAPWWKLKTAGAGGVGRAILYTRDPDSVTLEIPLEFTQHAAQFRNLELVTPTEGRVGGVLFYYPLSARYVDKID